MKKLKQVEKEIALLTQKIESDKGRVIQAQGRLKESKPSIDNLLEEQLPAAIVADDSKKVDSIEKKISAFKKSNTRDKALISGLEKNIEDLYRQLASAEKNRDEDLAKRAGKVLEGAISDYDETAKKLKGMLCRFMVLYRFLRDLGYQQDYVKCVGPAYSVLSNVKIPSITGFTLEEYNSTAYLHPGQALIDEVYREITQK
jgi:hypothetical protein